MNFEKKKEQVVVSLTSFPASLKYASTAIESVLSGSVLPDKVVLYLFSGDFKECGVPDDLLELQNTNGLFEIRFHDTNLRSYLKLIPALNDFPDAVIVTIDDDIRYDRNMLRDMLKTHDKFPHCIVGNRIRSIKIDRPYNEWRKLRWVDYMVTNRTPSFNNLQTGVGGVLYAPHCLQPDMLDEKLFMSIAPTADDLWFWAAAVANGTKIMHTRSLNNSLDHLGKPLELSLMKTNIRSGHDQNKEIFMNILARYPIVRNRISN